MASKKRKLLTLSQLKKIGFINKLTVLSPEEQDEWENGIKIINKDGSIGRSDTPPDYAYFFRVLNGGTIIKLHHVGKDVFYHGRNRVEYMDELDDVYKSARGEKIIQEVKEAVPNTEIVQPPQKQDIEKAIMEDKAIFLSGGPYDGQARIWNRKLRRYIALYENEGRRYTCAYEQDAEDDSMYHFKEGK